MVELIGLAKKVTVKTIVAKRYVLDEANSALWDLKNRKVIGRAIIAP